MLMPSSSCSSLRTAASGLSPSSTPPPGGRWSTMPVAGSSISATRKYFSRQIMPSAACLISTSTVCGFSLSRKLPLSRRSKGVGNRMWHLWTSFYRELWLTGGCAVFARSTIVTRATLLQRNVARIRLSVQWMADEYFGCCTRTLTTREVVTERQSDNRKRKRFPRSTSPDSKTWPAAGVGQYSG